MMLNYTPILSNITNKTIETFDKIFDITEEEIKDIKKENADQAILEILKESGIIAKENIVKLIEEGKLKEE